MNINFVCLIYLRQIEYLRPDIFTFNGQLEYICFSSRLSHCKTNFSQTMLYKVKVTLLKSYLSYHVLYYVRVIYA
jgi:hypothetical protein